jgi:putative addiction module killer protein
MLELVTYQSAFGRRPFAEWFAGLDEPAKGKVQGALDRLAGGHLSEIKSVGGGVLERRIHWGPGYRIYFGRRGAAIVVLLGGGTKRDQQTDIATAQRRWEDYKQRT